MKRKRGISLIVLAITIIVMIILAGAVIINITDTDLIGETKIATKIWDISQIKEQLESVNTIRESGLEGKYLQKVENGTLKDIGISETELMDKLLIENGKLVYRPEIVSDEEIQKFREEGINAGTHLGIVSSTASYSNYTNTANLITIDQIYNNTDKIMYLLEDITVTNMNSITEFTGTLDGNDYTISGLSNPLVINNRGQIKNLTLVGEISTYADILAGFVLSNYGTITNCTNKINLYASAYAAGIVVDNYETGTIINSSNGGNIQSDYAAAGIAVNNSGKIYNSYNEGQITGWEAAGIIHFPNAESTVSGKVMNCYNKGIIYADGESTGIATYGDGISNTYNIGDITGSVTFGLFNDAHNTKNSYAIKNVYDLVGSSKNDTLKWIDDLDDDGDSVSNLDKNSLLQRLNQGNSTKVWVEDTKNINNGYPILYWQAK